MSINGLDVVQLCTYVEGIWKCMCVFPWSLIPMAVFQQRQKGKPRHSLHVAPCDSSTTLPEQSGAGTETYLIQLHYGNAYLMKTKLRGKIERL